MNIEELPDFETGGRVPPLASKHTPGPWRLNDFYGANVDQRPIKAVVGPEGNGRLIHAVPDFMIDPESLANARLIAAAPELLEALERVAGIADSRHGSISCWCPENFLDSMPDDSEPDSHSSGCKAARAAIAKARGDA